MKKWIIVSESVEETMQVAYQLGTKLLPGDCITLEGDLGAGKTHFTKGIAKALNIDTVITSPTFTIIKEYTGKMSLYHMDVYRAGEEAFDLGLEEYFYGSGVTVVEWPHLIEEILPSTRFACFIKKIDDQRREITIEGTSSEFQKRIEELRP